MPRHDLLTRPESSSGCSSRGSWNNTQSSIVELPVEILLKIFDYFDPIFLVHTVSLVCKRFTTILKEDSYWRTVYFKVLRDYHTFHSGPILEHYGVLSEGWRCEPDIFWRDLTLRLVKLHDIWTKPINSIKLHSSTETVDAVHILKDNNLCVTGSREKCIDLWAIGFRPYIKSSVVEAHRGWVSCIQSFEKDSFISGSWDSTMSYWNIRPTMCEALWTFDCARPVFSIAARPGLIVAGLSNPAGGQIVLVDPRIRQNLSSIKYSDKIKFHNKTIVAVDLIDNYVVSVGRDSRLCSFDIRQQCVVHRTDLKAPRVGVPFSMATRNKIVYIGDNRGCLHLFDADRSFKIFQKIPIRPQPSQDSRISSICPELGAIIAGCSDGSVQVVVATDPVYKMKDLDVEHEVTSMSYRRSILAVGKTNGAVDVFKADMQGTFTIIPMTEDI